MGVAVAAVAAVVAAVAAVVAVEVDSRPIHQTLEG